MNTIKYLNTTDDDLDTSHLLGPYVRDPYQPQITGIVFEISSGTGSFKAELKGMNNQVLAVEELP